MNNAMPCGYRDDPRLWDEPTEQSMRAKQVEDYADNLMAECKDFKRAASINVDNDMYDGDLLPKLMVEIASWTGRSDDASERMRKMFNLLSGEFQAIAEREVA